MKTYLVGGAVRDTMEVAGVTDVLSKSLGSSNKINIGYATLAALRQIIRYSELHPRQAPASIDNDKAKQSVETK